jgi:hypothetical protein
MVHCVNLNFRLILDEHGHDPPHSHFIAFFWRGGGGLMKLRSLHSNICLGCTGVEKCMDVLILSASQEICNVPVCCSAF